MQGTVTVLRFQFDQMSVQATQFGDELRVVKGEVAEVNRLIGRLQSEIEAVKAQVQLAAEFGVPGAVWTVLKRGSSSTLSVAAWRTSWLRQKNVGS